VSDRVDAASDAADAAEMAVASGLFGWIGRGIAAVVRMLLRALG